MPFTYGIYMSLQNRGLKPLLKGCRVYVIRSNIHHTKRVEAHDARDAATQHGGASWITEIKVEATGEVVPPELWK